MKKIKTAIIFDLDNTIYPVSSIGKIKFADLFKLIEEDGSPYYGHSKNMRVTIMILFLILNVMFRMRVFIKI